MIQTNFMESLSSLPDENQKIWKYMPFDYFMLLLHQKSLYLPKASLNIYFEGWIREEDEQYLQRHFEHKGVPDAKSSARIARKKFEEFRQYTFLDCWQKNDIENFAMWKIFGNSNNSIALLSNIGKLKKFYNTVEETIYFNDIDYFKPDQINTFWNNKYMFFRKPGFFNYEKEVRGIIQGEAFRNLNNMSLKFSKLSDIADEIIICPYADSWFFDYISKKTKSINVKKSMFYQE